MIAGTARSGRSRELMRSGALAGELLEQIQDHADTREVDVEFLLERADHTGAAQRLAIVERLVAAAVADARAR